MEFFWKAACVHEPTVVALLWNINKRITKDWNRTTAGCCADADMQRSGVKWNPLFYESVREQVATLLGARMQQSWCHCCFHCANRSSSTPESTKKELRCFTAWLHHDWWSPPFPTAHRLRHLIRCAGLHRMHAGCKKSNLIAFSCCWHFCQSCVDSILLSPCLWRLLTVEEETAPEGLFEK